MMFCPRCLWRVRYSFAMCWWECRCRVWTTDEIIARDVN